MKVDEFEKKINYKFKNKSLINLAFTHSSFKNKKNKNYERLEFLGDRVLSLVISEHLFLKYPNENEGALSKRLANLVSKKTLLEVANEISIKKMLKIDQFEKKNLKFENKDNYYGFGWSHNSGKPGIWSEGPMSTLFFRTDKNYGDLKLEILCQPYITKKNNISELDIYINNTFNQNLKLTKNNQDEKIEILINEKLIKNNEIKIDFKFKNLVSPYEVLESPDSRKLGLLVKNIKISPV